MRHACAEHQRVHAMMQRKNLFAHGRHRSAVAQIAANGMRIHARGAEFITKRLRGEKIAVGVDIKDGMVAIKGWTEVSQESCFDFCEKLQKIGVKTIICTDISKDGLLSGTNLELYKELSEKFSVDIVASGGVTTLDDVKKLADMGMYGAILGKALYTGNIDLKAAVELTKGGK